MPSLWGNILKALNIFFEQKGRFLVRVLRAVALILVAAFVLETFVFNFNHFVTSGYKATSLDGEIRLRETASGGYRLTEAEHVLEFSNVNTKVNNILLDFDSAQPAQLVQVKIDFTDEAHHTYFESTEYTADVPLVDVSTFNSHSEYINLKTTGHVDSLRIEIVGENVRYPLLLSGISLNVQRPFSFEGIRFLVVVGVLALICIFRPGSPLYRYYIREHPGQSRSAVVLVAFAQIWLIGSLLFFGSNMVGVATSNYNYGQWDGKSLVNTYAIKRNSQQYAELAKAFTEGKLHLAEEPPAWLTEMDNPYDKGARDELAKETGELPLNDVVYYNGHYYVYFGVVPVLVFYLPFHLLTGGDFPTAIGVLIAMAAFVVGCSAMLDRFARYHFKRVSLGIYFLVQIPLVLCCGILYLVKFPTFYSLPIILGLAFSVWGLYFWMKGRGSPDKAGLWYLAGSLCMALVAGCRPQLLALSLLAFPLFWRSFITKRHILTAKGVRELACLSMPFLFVIAGIMWYNDARFGSVFDFGANYNLTLNDMTKRGVNPGRFAPAFFAYFIQPPTVSGVFPFLQPAVFETTYLGQTIKEATFGGIFACLPLLWVLIFSRRILALRIKQRSTRTVAGVIVVLLVAGVLVGLFDAQMAGILQRYYADFSFMFLVAAVLLVFIANENLEKGSALQGGLLKLLILLVTISVLYSVLMCFVPEVGWYSDAYPWAYQSVLEIFRFWT